MEVLNESNFAKLRGVVTSKAEFSHEVFEEKYYRIYIETKRLSDMSDILPVIISEKIINVDEINIGDVVYIEGQIRSHNDQIEERKSKLILSIFTKEIQVVSKDEDTSLNEVSFEGYICKAPIYRKTPLGREITDVLIAVNRAYKKSDYIPCILWGRNAKFCESLEVGSKVKVVGRMQSRKYTKKIDNDQVQEMTAYEVSTSIFKLITEENENTQNKEAVVEE